MSCRGSIRLTFSSLALVSALAIFVSGCDDAETPGTPVDMGDATVAPFGGAGGMPPVGGFGGEGAAGGEGGDAGGMGGDDMGPVCDCAGNQVCDEGGACIEAPDGCGEDVDCLDPRICEDGACADGCTSDDECADPAAATCIDGRCGNCREDADCFGVATCADSLCVAPNDCTASRECGVGQVCVGDDCVADFDCAEAGCPGGFICGADGECRALPAGAACEDAAACPLGQVCDGRPLVCRLCQDDAHCVGNQVCQRDPAGNRCVEPERCVDDTDCLGTRSCQAERCAAPRCDDDAIGADNGTADLAAMILGDQSYLGLINCGEEWFEFSLPADTVATVVLRQVSRDADLRLEAFAANGVLIGRSDSGRATESVVVGPFASERPIRLRISQVDAATVVEYRLDIGFEGRGDACVDDAAEAGLGDDDVASARIVRGADDLAFGPASGRLCPGDADWICFQMQPRERLTITVAVTGAGTVGGELIRDGDIEEQAEWTSEGGDALVLPGAVGGTYCLALTADAGVGYVADIQAVNPDVVRLCQFASPIEVDDVTSGVLADDDEDRLSPSCALDRADGGEAAYLVTINDPSLLIARAHGTADGSLGDPVLSLRGNCESANSEMACATGWYDPGAPLLIEPNPAEIRVPVQPGDYTLIVDGTGPGNRPRFDLEVITRRLSARPGNDTCDTAEPIELTNGRARIRVNLDQARDDTSSCLGRGAPDVVYSLSLDSPARVRADVAAQGNEFAVGAYLVQRCGDPMPVACGFGFDEVVPAGEWLLVVDGSSNNSRGSVELDVDVEAFGDAPDNDQCDAATVLAAGQVVEGDTRAAQDDVSLVAGNRCTGHDSRGGDLAYVADLAAGQRYFVQAVPDGGWDLSLFVVGDCARADESCVAGSDGALTESVVFTAREDGDHFIVIDGSAGEGGRFTLRYGAAECGRDADCPGGTCGPDFTCQ